MVFLFSYSCEDYLDKAPESTLTEEDVFKDFDHAQGFVEEMYQLVVDYGTAGHTFQDYIFGDDAYASQGYRASGQIDNGTLGFWVTNKYCYLNDNGKDDLTQKNARNRPGLWDGSLKGIRRANIVIKNIDLMVNASQDEKDVILGQAYFFRAFFHNEIMKFWGRFPYIKDVISDYYELPRPDTYKECALEANEDYKKAIALLPVDWDDMSYGQKTLGENKLRVTKGAAYAFQGKNLLLAASPLMYFNNQSDINTYEYDTELCNMAVDAFAKVLELDDQGVYDLVPFDRYEEVFWKSPSANVFPGSTEFIFSAPGGNVIDARRFMCSGTDKNFNGVYGMNQSPTHNFIYNNFGMANGLSIEDDLSGKYGSPTYDPTKPFENRDPRLYKWVILDGDTLATKATAPANQKIAQLYTGGEHRKYKSSSLTGYMQKKFYPTLHSKWNNIIKNYLGVRLHMRLTDVYLMYAEALHAAKGATTAPDSYRLTAEQAINILRDRAGIPHVNSLIVADNNKFMDEIRRERSVELCYEAHRWVDIRRWGIANLDKYKIKTALDFPKDHSYFKETVLKVRVCEYPKHFWLPFQANQTQFYEGFPQNPGW